MSEQGESEVEVSLYSPFQSPEDVEAISAVLRKSGRLALFHDGILLVWASDTKRSFKKIRKK